MISSVSQSTAMSAPRKVLQVYVCGGVRTGTLPVLPHGQLTGLVLTEQVMVAAEAVESPLAHKALKAK